MSNNNEINVRLKQAIHYICHFAGKNDLTLGSIRLQKILFHADREFYSRYFRALTQDAYIKGQNGPYQEDVQFAVEQLQKERVLSVKKSKSHGELTKYSARKPPVTEFTPEECSLLDRWTKEICEENTSIGVSEATHNAVWRMAQMKEPIPLAAQMIGNSYPPTKEDWEWAEKVSS